MSEQQSKLIRRRAFLKGIISLGVLALLSFLIPSFLRKSNQPAEPVILSDNSPSASSVESGTSGRNEEKPVAEEKETGDAVFHTTLAIIYRDELEEYNFGPGRLFQGRRYGAFIRYLQEHLPAENNYRILESECATDEDLLLISGQDYIDFNKRYFKRDRTDWPVDEDFLKYQSLDNRPVRGAGRVEYAARLLVGQAKMATDLVQTGEFKKTVSVGGGMHHAFRDRGGPFCLYNDVAFSALYLIKQYGLERILILDTDAHAGDGTSSYFYSDPRVLFIDIHQDPATLFPGIGFVDEIGDGAGKGYTINIPLPPESDYECYQRVFESVVEPVTQEFRPQIIIWNGGADTLNVDPMTDLGLKITDYRKLGARVRQMAEICDGKAIRLMISGYVPEMLPMAWFGTIIGLGGIEYDGNDEEEIQVNQESLSKVILRSKTEETIIKARRHLRGYWNSLR